MQTARFFQLKFIYFYYGQNRGKSCDVHGYKNEENF